ncbi:CinA family protein [Loktanella salsilacus]|jgi:nicotinamide-nucleotide amidase|uniref:CinA family protein n=1 Tax=Loktanella salsilacus TaxID=195913 RepID=UPI003001F7D7
MTDAAQLLDLARARGIKIALAESCTGGMIAAALTEVAGSSDVFDRGWVTYSNSAKMQMLGILQDTLDDFGAVSEEIAREMAQGAFDQSDAQIALSVTGIAGPGGSEHKPEGRVCFGIATGDGVHMETVEFGALGRGQVRAAAVAHGLDLLTAGVVQFSIDN